MIAKHWRLTAVALLVACSAGCFRAPETLSRAGLVTPEAVSRRSAEYWDRYGSATATLPASGRVVIDDFAVEFVLNSESVLPFERQVIFVPPPIEPLDFAITAAIEASGLGRASPQYPDPTIAKVTRDLYDRFVRDLDDRGLTLVPVAEMKAAPEYRKYRVVDHDETSLLLHFQVILGSDAGRISSTTTRTIPELGVVTNPENDDRNLMRDRLLRQTNADAVISVRLLVASYRGKAAIERGSDLRIATKSGDFALRSDRTLLSDENVITQSHWEPVAGWCSTVSPDRFPAAMVDLLMPYVDMGLGPVRHRPATTQAAGSR